MKSYRIIGPMFGKIWLMLKKLRKIGISAHFSKQQKAKRSILRGYDLVQVGVIIWSKFGAS